jgi:hypothetical protein
MSYNEWDLTQDERNAIKAIIAERDTLSNHLGNLLAVIHGDGGHYQGEHGTDKAVSDAMLIVSRLTAERDALKAENEKLVDTLSDWSDQYTMVISDKCPSDEQHCTCVPALREEISKLRTALRYYADVSTYQNASPNNDDGYRVDHPANIDIDGGDIARKALEVKP